MLRLLRVSHWIKNLFIFAGIIFSRHFVYPDELRTVFFAFLVFCGVSSGVYIINDLLDLSRDRHHPEKKTRPLASGRVTPGVGLIFGTLLLGLGNWFAYLLRPDFFLITITYTGMMFLYSLMLKDFIILDILVVASGYVLRAAGGALVIGVEISSWLLICTFLIALFLVMAKRRHELMVIESPAQHRMSLAGYSPLLLDQMISVVTSATVVSYAFYTLSPQTIAKFQTKNLVFTVPIVIYGVFRYLYIVYKKSEAGAPESAVVRDRPLLLAIMIWVIGVLFIIR
ncbi:MAG TPA: decaprenyl-phosphate phosphoribosyltransferase [bacterium (Candidatus Stahlbacteria)]|nr:decaprenyl-phosphate phosphoribosyltransferase [Candidatus Stahlbacteria bacterium]